MRLDPVMLGLPAPQLLNSASSFIVSGISISIVGANLVVTGTTNKTLADGLWGFVHSKGVGIETTFWEGVLGAASAQSITKAYADLGVGSGDTLNVQACYQRSGEIYDATQQILVGSQTAVVVP